MPTYEYACTACGQHSEVFQRFDEAPLTTCASCGGELRKVFHAAGIVFKGSGFYATDNRSRKASTTDGGSSSTSAAPSTPASPSTPSTPAAPSTTSSTSDGGAS